MSRPKKKQGSHKKVDISKLRLGDSVRVLSMGLKGTVSALPDKSGKLWVQCGIIKSQVKTDDIELIDEADITGPGYKSAGSGRKPVSSNRISKTQHISTEINLLGMTVDEALYTLDKYLDDAYLAHLPSVRIVHGKGTCALRNAVAAHLKKTKYIASYRLGEYGEGDAGVTIAEFR
jgi:DNA mismatch repair protein MutS2